MREGTRTELVDQIIALKCIENDLVIRLCKLNDKRKDTSSFKNALKEYIYASEDSKGVKQIENKIAKYETLTSELKKRRDEELGHLAKGAKDNFDPQFNLLPTLRVAVELVDMLHGKPVSYTFKDDMIYEDLKNIVA